MDELIEHLHQLRNTFGEVAMEVYRAQRPGEQEPNVELLCHAMYILQELKRDIASCMEELEAAIAENAKESIFFLENGQRVERRVGSERKAWDHKGLANVVANRVYQSSVDMETGEIVLNPVEMMTKMLEFAAPSYWRIKELDKIGVSVDAYCEKLPGKTSIIISPLSSETK